MRGLAISGVVVGWLLAAAPALAGQAPAAPKNEDCLACHSDASTTRGNGQPVVVAPDKFAKSVHAPLNCVDCHSDLAKAVEFPHAATLAKVNCATCHDTASEEYAKGIHAQARRKDPNSRAASCVDCHDGQTNDPHEILPSSDPASATNKMSIVQTCGKCHGNKAPVTLPGGRSGAVAATYMDSIHGRALLRSGLVVAPTCSDCHGNHDIIPKRMTDSPVFLKNVPATCGKCHEGIRQDYAVSIHGTQLAGGNLSAPNCSSCHSAHSIQRTDNPNWQLHAIEQCGTCHKESLSTYRDTFHGQVTALGFTPVAKCVDCHQQHKVLATTDVKSPVNPANLTVTCGKCHQGANANFVKYNPHANKHDKSRLPVLYYSARFMDALLVFVFGFFGLHTFLWFSRGRQGARAQGPRPPLRAVAKDAPSSGGGHA